MPDTVPAQIESLTFNNCGTDGSGKQQTITLLPQEVCATVLTEFICTCICSMQSRNLLNLEIGN